MAETRERYPEGCPTGSAVATSAGRLPARKIFHAVGPRWHGGGKGERGLLRNAYRTCLELAAEHECDQIACPAISTGAYGYPMDLAAEDSLAAVREFLLQHGKPKLVRFVLFGEGALGAFSRALEALAS
jgi:O-acetyl-ADP-ribose deacetylase (regulator of RNase III)